MKTNFARHAILVILIWICASVPAQAITFQVQYFNNQAHGGTPVATGTEDTIDHDWGYDSPWPGKVTVDDFSIVWQANFQVTAEDDYTFSVEGDDGINIGITDGTNGWTTFNQWPNNNVWSDCPTHLYPGVMYTITLDYYENTGTASAHMKWVSVHNKGTLIQPGPNGNGGGTGTTIGQVQGLTGQHFDTQNTLNWNAVDGANGYHVYRHDNTTGTFTPIGSPATPGFNDTGANWSQYVTYTYQVTAVNGTAGLEGLPSNPPVTVAAPPAAVYLDVDRCTSSPKGVTLYWSGGAGATEIHVKRRLHGIGDYTDDMNFTQQPFPTTFTDSGTGWDAATSYDYIVIASNAPGVDTTSDKSYTSNNVYIPSFTTKCYTIGKTNHLEWTPIGTEKYYLYRGVVGQGATKLNTTASSAHTFDDTSISFGVNYYYYLTVAEDGGGESNPSDTIDLTATETLGITIANPVASHTVTAPVPIRIEVSSNGDLTDDQVRVYVQGTNPAGTEQNLGLATRTTGTGTPATAEYTMTWSPPVSGVYEMEAVVTDAGANAQNQTLITNITVNNFGNYHHQSWINGLVTWPGGEPIISPATEICTITGMPGTYPVTIIYTADHHDPVWWIDPEADGYNWKKVSYTADSVCGGVSTNVVDKIQQDPIQRIAKLQYSTDNVHFTDAPIGDDPPLSEPAGTSVYFQAIPLIPGVVWPTGLPKWGGLANGTGSNVVVTLNTPTTGAYDQVSASCANAYGGNTVICKVDVTPATPPVRHYALTTDSSVVAAGAMNTPEHKTGVTITVTDDSGHGVSGIGVSPTVSGGDAAVDGNGDNDLSNDWGIAHLIMNKLQTDSSGTVKGTYYSSDVVRDVVISVQPQSGPAITKTITQSWDNGNAAHWTGTGQAYEYDKPCNIQFQPMFTRGTSEIGIPKHVVRFYATLIVISYVDPTTGTVETQNIDPTNQNYGYFSGLVRFGSLTNANGIYTAQMTVRSNATYNVDSVIVNAYDFGTFTND